MKVRWTDESLRLRITPSELALLVGGATLEQALYVPGGGWRVRVIPSVDALSIHCRDSEMIVELSPTDIARLADPSREGVYAHTPRLRLMVEKDFPCAHPHSAEAAEPPTERFTPTSEYASRKMHAGS